MATTGVPLDASSRSAATIVHVDMDAFYAAVEERDRPELRGQPLIVGGTPQGRGVVAAANYVVRKFGVHSAMPTAQALRLCPEAVVLRPRMSHYAAVSRQIREIFFSWTPLVEPLALDEACLDLSGCERLHGPVVDVARRIQLEIRERTGLDASVGIAPTRFVAKLASDLEKPNGFVHVPAARVQAFLDPLPIDRLWGVGAATARRFRDLRIETVGAFRRLDADWVADTLGDAGRHLWELAHGIDPRPVVPDRRAKSISHETTFPSDISDPEILCSWLRDLTDQVARRLRRVGIVGRTVHLKARFADFQTVTRSQSLPQATSASDEIWEHVRQLYRRHLQPGGRAVRLLGVGLSQLQRSGSQQRQLFDESHRRQRQSLDRVTDEIVDRFGQRAVRRGSGLLRDDREQGDL